MKRFEWVVTVEAVDVVRMSTLTRDIGIALEKTFPGKYTILCSTTECKLAVGTDCEFEKYPERYDDNTK